MSFIIANVVKKSQKANLKSKVVIGKYLILRKALHYIHY